MVRHCLLVTSDPEEMPPMCGKEEEEEEPGAVGTFLFMSFSTGSKKLLGSLDISLPNTTMYINHNHVLHRNL